MWSQMMYVRADQRHYDVFDSDVDKYFANDYTWTDNEDEIEDINPKCNAVIEQIGN